MAEYAYSDAREAHGGSYLRGPVMTVLRAARHFGARRVLDLGCGNGFFAKEAATLGFEVVGVDPSTSGIHFATKTPSSVEFHVGSAYEPLKARFGTFDVILSLEVIEHLYDPRAFVRNVVDALDIGGLLILSTPYHGYWKNLALALTGRMDAHFTALWDHGHIKFWSKATIRTLLEEAGFDVGDIVRIGRVPPLAKTMIVVARRRI